MARDPLESRRDWEGTADELVAEVASMLGTAVAEHELQPNVRLLRHYQTVGAVSRPSRRGKQAVYGYRHLLETLVVRGLVISGWPLSKVAEMTGAATDEELKVMLPEALLPATNSPEPGNRAQDLVRRFAQEAAVSYGTSRRNDAPGDSVFAASVSSALASTDVTAWRRTIEFELPFSARLSIDAQRLEHLAPDEIRQLGDALVKGLRAARQQQQKRTGK